MAARRRLTVKWNVLPCPSVLSSQSRPPISSTSWEEIVSPIPVPPKRRVVEPSAWMNGEDRLLLVGRDADAGVAHGDVQDDLVLTLGIEADGLQHLAFLGEPERVATRLRSTCRRRDGSPIT